MERLVKVCESRNLDEQRKIQNQRIKDFLYIYEKYNHQFIKRPCPICGSEASIECDKFFGTYNIDRCSVCTSIYVNPCPNIEAVSEYYGQSKSNKMVADVYRKRHKQKNNFMLDERVEFVYQYIQKTAGKKIKILEIGCGVGSFLSRLKDRLKEIGIENDVDLFGIDIDEEAINNSVDEDLHLFSSTAEDFIETCEEKFDIIIHFELIEHLIDPYNFMKGLNSLLSEKGYILFTTPNYNGLEQIAIDYNTERLLPHSIYPPIHINGFTTMNLTHFIIRCGYKLVDIDTPGKLDVDIVSIHKDKLKDEGLSLLCDLDDEVKAIIQHLVMILKGSSHMRCVVQKRSECIEI